MGSNVPVDTEAMGEALCRAEKTEAFAQACQISGQAGFCIGHDLGWRAALAAPPSDAEVEAAAKAAHGAVRGDGSVIPPWEMEFAHHRDTYREAIRAALTAARSVQENPDA